MGKDRKLGERLRGNKNLKMIKRKKESIGTKIVILEKQNQRKIRRFLKEKKIQKSLRKRKKLSQRRKNNKIREIKRKKKKKHSKMISFQESSRRWLHQNKMQTS